MDSKHTAFLFPGQGSQFVGMAKDIHAQFSLVRDLFDRAAGVLGFDLRGPCFDGPEETLRQTRTTQPALFVHSFAVAGLLREKKILPAATAGHSLGEYSALACAGAFSFESGLRLVQKRSQLMQDVAARNPGCMAAVIGISGDDVLSVCREASQSGTVVAANFNSPEQTVISGSKEGVARAVELAKARGAKRAIELAVSGAFHSPLMAEAGESFSRVLAKIELSRPEIPVYANVTAQPVSGAEALPDLMAKQLVSPVRWVETIQNMVKNGITTFVEIGPGKVLSGLVKRIAPEAETRTCGTAVEIEALSL
jgi:[acyl-carrier-protein] S-malonyltransferase